MRLYYFVKYNFKYSLVMATLASILIYNVANAQEVVVVSQTIRVVTAYNAGDPRQTDDTPCISANNKNICEALDRGEMQCAANFVSLGTVIHIDKVGDCLVTDRTNRRYRNRVDIAMKKNEYKKAITFGRQKLMVKILK